MDLAKSDKPRKGGGQQVTALVGLVQQGVRASEPLPLPQPPSIRRACAANRPVNA